MDAFCLRALQGFRGHHAEAFVLPHCFLAVRSTTPATRQKSVPEREEAEVVSDERSVQK